MPRKSTNGNGNAYQAACQATADARAALAATREELAALEVQIATFLKAGEDAHAAEHEYAALTGRAKALERVVTDAEQAEAAALTGAMLDKLASLRDEALKQWDQAADLERRGRAIQDEANAQIAALRPQVATAKADALALDSKADELAAKLHHDAALSAADRQRLDELQARYADQRPATHQTRIAFDEVTL